VACCIENKSTLEVYSNSTMQKILPKLNKEKGCFLAQFFILQVFFISLLAIRYMKAIN
jgi:hypothetical protein